MLFSRSFVVVAAAAMLVACSNSSGTAVAPIAGSATASPVATPVAIASPTPLPTATPTTAPTATPTAKPSPTPTPAPTATATPSPAPTTTTAADGCPEYPSGNIIADPGAESATTADTAGDMVPVPSWTPSGTFTAVQYLNTEGSFPSLTDAGPPNRGSILFAGGPSAAVSTGRQVYQITGTQIGSTPFVMCGWFGGFSSQNDNATLDAQFVAADGTKLSDPQIGGATAAQRGSATSLLKFTYSGYIPAGATQIIFTLTMARTDGTYNDGYADNLDVSIGPLGTAPLAPTSTLRGSRR